MADVFFKADAQKLLKKKHIVFFGDSNARAIYKDLIWLLNRNKIIDQAALKRKQEPSFCGDRLDKHSELHRGREYEEERSYRKGDVQIDFFFITKCYNPLLVDMMEDIHLGLREAPDVIYINSTLWDVSRWGPNGVIEFKDNLQKLARLFKSSLPTSTLVIWATALPVSSKVHSSLLIKQIDFLQHTLRFDVMEANQFARQVMVNHGFDVLDNHFHMRMQVHRRVHDGVHYFPTAIRLLTNLLLTHIALSWDVPLPNRVDTILLDKTKALCGGKTASPVPELKTPKVLANKAKKPPLPPHILAKMISSPGKNQNQFKKYNKGSKPKKYRRKLPYQRVGQNNFGEEKPPILQGRFRQLRGVKGVDHRNSNWRQDSEKHSMWSETPPPAVNPWSPWVNNLPQTTNWSEDHWPDELSFGSEQMFNKDPRMDAGYNHNSILARTGDLLARTMRHQLLQPNRYMPPY